LKKRTDVPLQYTWDTSSLYSSQQAWEDDLQEICKQVGRIVDSKGKITTSAPNLLEALQLMDQIGIKLEWAASYARMNFDVDMGSAASKQNYERIDNLYSKIGPELAFYEPELLKLEPAVFEQFVSEQPALKTYAFMFEKLFKEKEHVLSTNEEEILSRMGSLSSTFKKIFDDITVLDLEFPEIDDGQGKKITANETNYRIILNSYDRDLRERYFKAFLGAYGSHINSLTSSATGNLKYRVFTAKTRKYATSRQMSLDQNHIPVAVYDTLIRTVRENAHLLQRYIAFRQQTLQYKDIHFYDLFVPLVKDVEKTFTFEEARDIVLDALSILGPDYQKVLQTAFSQRWIDVYPNKGKTPGAYASGIFNLHPYSLLNFTGTMDDIFTIAHELGHVMHSYYSNRTQPYVDSDYVIFTAEVASTVNEYLLYRYFLNRSTSKDDKAYLLSMHLDSIRSTLYRQTFFADFEQQMHDMVEQDTPVTPDFLCDSYRKLYELYHGPDFSIDDELTYEWARIPHFYNSFYVYQYATGLSAAITLAKGILAEGGQKTSAALSAYLNFLTRGGSDYPINLLKGAGVDLSTSAPIIAALQDFSDTLELLMQTL